MKFFKDAYLHFGKPNSVITKEEFYSIFENINLNENDFNTQNYLPGTKGQSALYKDLKTLSGI